MLTEPRIEGLKGSWEWLRFAAQLPAQAIPFTNLSAATPLYTGRCIVVGASFVNSATIGGHLSILDGQDGTGGQVWAVGASASSTVNTTIPQPGALCEAGLTLVAAGLNITGSVLFIPLWHDEYTAPGT